MCYARGARVLVIFRLLAGIWIFCFLAWGQQLTPGWRKDVQRCVEAKDWSAAMDVVDREFAHAPQDMEIRAWRARVLMWSGKIAESEGEYLEILAAAPNDPDDWMGLANVYSREGRTAEARQALDRAVELDPKRADFRAARGRALQAEGEQKEAKLEFHRALELDPNSTEARAGLLSLRSEPRHEVR